MSQINSDKASSAKETSNQPSNQRSSQWILLRGLARESRHWGDFPKRLEGELADRGPVRVDAIDLPGTGRYSEMRSPLSIGEITEFVRHKFLEMRQRQRDQGGVPPQEVHLLAFSLGGMVACEWLQRWPEDFQSAVLINTSFRSFSPIYHRLNVSSLKHIVAASLAREDAKKRELNILKLISNRPENYDRVAGEWARLHESRPISGENFMRQVTAAARFQPADLIPDLPVLVLNSPCDRMVNPSCSEQIARRWNAHIRRHPSAGHDLTLDDGPWVVEQIRSWLAKIG